MGQFPLRWTDTFRAVTNVMMDGSMIVSADAGATGVAWDIALAGLSDAEEATLQNFFESVQGGLDAFTMLDPADNLLAYSQDFTQACWVNGPLLAVTPGVADPFGGTTAATLTNTGQAVQSLSQQINGPGGYQYCFSVYLRSASGQTVTLTQSGAGSPLQQAVQALPGWSRFLLSGATGTGDGVTFSIALAPGAQIYVACAQAEAQPGAGAFKATGVSGGVYQNCRFDQDQLGMTATGPNQYSCTIRIRSTVPPTWEA